MAIDRPKDGAVVDPGYGKPIVEGDDGAMPGSAVGDADLPPRAFLIGLRAPQGDDDTLPDVARCLRSQGQPVPSGGTRPQSQ